MGGWQKTESLMKILVVDDEKLLVKGIKFNLENEGYQVDVCYDGETAVDMARRGEYAVILLDLMMPKLDGLGACQQIRQFSTVPIIMLTARSEDADKLIGFESGADDYITKPFDSKEMAARVKAVLRRTMGQTEEEEESNDDTLSFPGLTVSLSRYEVFYEGKKLEMPPKELEVLYFLASHVNQLFTRGQLLDQVWGFQVEVESRTVDVHVKRLRDKLVGCEKYGWRIQTIWGRGYKFEVIK